MTQTEKDYRTIFQEKKYVKVMFDYSSSGLWDYEGANIDDSDLPISSELREKISQWVRDQDYVASSYFNFDIRYPEPQDRPPEIQALMEKIDKVNYEFFLKMVDLAIEIKKELPDWTVMIYNEYPGLGLPINERNSSEIIEGYQRVCEEISPELLEHELKNFKFI